MPSYLPSAKAFYFYSYSSGMSPSMLTEKSDIPRKITLAWDQTGSHGDASPLSL
jgi:hypothetical protein